MLVLNKGFNYSQDGPGNRLVYHLQGCNFSCKWCSNADTIPLSNPKAKNISIDDIVKEIISCKMMFFDNGGVTFTGGEATLQHEELFEILKKCKENSINTCVETNGSSKFLLKLCEHIDYLIFDFKHFDESEHIRWCGCSNKSVVDNLNKLFSLKRQLHIRIPLINSINIFPNEFSDYFIHYDTSNTVFEFLAYHEYGKDKWQGNYEISNGFVTKEIIDSFIKAFNEKGLKTVTT